MNISPIWINGNIILKTWYFNDEIMLLFSNVLDEKNGLSFIYTRFQVAKTVIITLLKILSFDKPLEIHSNKLWFIIIDDYILLKKKDKEIWHCLSEKMKSCPERKEKWSPKKKESQWTQKNIVI